MDLLQLHNATVEDLERGKLVDVLREIQSTGKTRWIGASSTAPHLATFIDWGVFDAFQVPYSALERTHEDLLQRAYAPNLVAGVRGALSDVGLSRGRVGFDDLRFGQSFASPALHVVDATGARLPQAQLIRNVVDEGVLADALGIHPFGVGEHHRPDFAISAPAPVLAAIASRTEYIRLGTAVTVLSSDDPLRIFERFETEVNHGVFCVGSPETVARKIARTVQALNVDRFDLKYSNGTLPHERLMTAIELYGRRVIPHVQQLLASDALAATAA